MSVDPAISQAVQDYAKAIWSLQGREEGPLHEAVLQEFHSAHRLSPNPSGPGSWGGELG